MRSVASQINRKLEEEALAFALSKDKELKELGRIMLKNYLTSRKLFIQFAKHHDLKKLLKNPRKFVIPVDYFERLQLMKYLTMYILDVEEKRRRLPNGLSTTREDTGISK